MFESRKRDRDTRAGFEREINVLFERLMNRQMFFAKGMKNEKDLKNVRYSPNKRANLDTITEMVRTTAMSINFNIDEFITKDKDE